MGFQESLDFLYGLQKFGIKLGLENIRALLDGAGRPQQAYAALHVAGSNGKGSVCAALAEILRRSGRRVGLYTSPHLHAFVERIRIDGVPISEAEIIQLTAELRDRTAGIPATFFEFTTALALLGFARRQVEYAVLETGMGGRLDATNVVLPQVTVITSICRDHVEHLGSDPAAIAAEKGGIIKQGVPVVIGPQRPEVEAVLLEIARERQAPAVLCGRDFSFAAAGSSGFNFHGLGVELENLQPALAGAHQHENLALALAAAAVLRRRGADLPLSALRQGVEQVCWPGRLEWWRGERVILLDGAHNEGGAVVLADYLGSLKGRCRWVAAIKRGKAVEQILAPLLPLAAAVYATVLPVEQAVPPEELVAAARDAGVPARAFAEPTEALRAALRERREGETVLVAGSLFLVAVAREWLSARENSAS